MEQQLVVFDLAREHYGVPIGAVQSIIKMQAITFMPQAPSFVDGITNLRGQVLPVVDPRKRFGLPTAPATAESRMVVVEIGQAAVALIVDRVSEVLRVDEAVIEPPSPIVVPSSAAYIQGIVKLAGREVILLDLGRVLSSQEQSALTALPART